MTLAEWALVSWMTLSGADTGSTVGALHLGARETNPLITPAPRLLLPIHKGISTTAMIHLVERLQRKHPKWTLAIGIGAAIGYAWVVHHNWDVIRQQPAPRRLPPFPLRR